MRFNKSILVAAAALAMPLFMQAASVTSNPTLTVAGLTFSNFGCVLSTHGAATPGDCSEVMVNTTTMPGNGIVFSDGFSAAGKNNYSDIGLSYNVSSTAGIDEVGLSFDGNFHGHAIASVDELIWSGSTLVGEGSVSCGYIGGCSRTTEIALSGDYTNLFIQKDIQLDSYKAGADARASFVDQTFSTAPEPSSIALLGSGLLGAAGLLRRRKSAVKA